jgi:3',5'-cyclic AMP phosphodiesterase CpdA
VTISPLPHEFDETGRPVLTLLHISDLHFGSAYVPKVGAALLQVAPTLHVDAIVASGDFTQRARREEFAAARAFLNQLPAVPMVVIPGNHDVPVYRIWERIVAPHRNYREAISPELHQVLELDKTVIVALDSTAPHTAISNGRIRRSELEFATRALTAAPAGWARIVVAHHHFAPAPDYAGGQVMPQAKRALDLFTKLRVDLILGGHLHRGYIGNSLDVYPGVDREHGIIIVQCGTTTSRRGRGREKEKNSFNVIRIEDAVIRITHYMYFDDAAGFVPASEHLFPRSPLQFFAAPESRPAR